MYFYLLMNKDFIIIIIIIRLNWTLCERADLRRGLTFG